MGHSGSKRYIPFTYKMMIPYLILVLLTDVLIGYISYTMLVESRTEMAETNIRSALEQTRSTIKYQMDEIERMSDTLFSSLSFQDALQKQGEPLEIMLKMRDEIIPQMKAPLLLFGNDLRLAVYPVNEQMLEVPGDDMDKPILRRDYYVLSSRKIEGQAWFRKLMADHKDDLWLQVESDQELGNLSHFRKLFTSSGQGANIGYVRITVRLADLLGNFATFATDEGIRLHFIDRVTGQILYRLGTGDEGKRGETSNLVIRESIPGAGYAIETLVPRSYLNKDASRLQQAIFTVCLISFIGMAFIGFMVARFSGKKMRRILRLIRSFQDGHFEKRVTFPGNDEFVHILHSFNSMAASIQDLIKNVYVQGIQKKQAELDALQAQINPHFLYNTLSTIGSLANLGETEKVTEMVKGLAKFYRLTLNDGNVYLTLGKEIEQVETYLEIQRVKYAKKFVVYVDVEEEVREMPVIKLILQPFVENIFKHAWFEGIISIRITGRRVGEQVELGIIDNGVGMSRETLGQLRSGHTRTNGYGLKNVEERIKLRYGSEYGIHIASIYGAGTAVRIVLPVEQGELGEREEKDGYL